MGANDRLAGGGVPVHAAPLRFKQRGGGPRIAGAASLSVHGTEAEREKQGFEAGHAAGLAQAQHDAQAQRAAERQRLELVLKSVQARFDELSSQGADAVLDLALDIAAQVIRREVRTQRDAILPVVQEALALVIQAYAQPTVRLAPVDFELVRDSLGGDGRFHGCRWVADGSVAPGGCRIESPQAEVDATIATRWRRVVQTLGCTAPAPETGAP